MWKIFSRIPPRDVYIITKLTPELYSNSKIKNKEIGEQTKLLSKRENAIIVFDDNLGTSNRKYLDQFFVRGRHD